MKRKEAITEAIRLESTTQTTTLVVRWTGGDLGYGWAVTCEPPIVVPEHYLIGIVWRGMFFEASAAQRNSITSNMA